MVLLTLSLVRTIQKVDYCVLKGSFFNRHEQLILKEETKTCPLCFVYWGNFGRVIGVLIPRNWLRDSHLRVSKMCLCALYSENFVFALEEPEVHDLKCSAQVILVDINLMPLVRHFWSSFFNILKFISAQLHFLTTQLAILHNCNNFHAQTESIAGSK